MSADIPGLIIYFHPTFMKVKLGLRASTQRLTLNNKMSSVKLTHVANRNNDGEVIICSNVDSSAVLRCRFGATEPIPCQAAGRNAATCRVPVSIQITSSNSPTDFRQTSICVATAAHSCTSQDVTSGEEMLLSVLDEKNASLAEASFKR